MKIHWRNYQQILDALERAADVAWDNERDREDREEVAATEDDLLAMEKQITYDLDAKTKDITYLPPEVE